ncbi:MAG TPA: DUF3089 domain-containing protein [Bacteroidia bacterium]|nr:DUF3089 domain-containing protein [Bacteroidia bacterium]
MKNKVLFILTALALLTGCLTPWFGFDSYKAPPVPDYSNEDAWSALPWRHDAADTVPPGLGLKDDQANAKVDVFFIYPTLDLRITHWNVSIYDRMLNSIIDKTTIRQQAGVFNGSCRIFAPRYRQGVFGSFIDSKGNGTKALKLAYSDVRAAFQYYMQHYNQGRPVIIAGHSQGCMHAYRLVREFFDTTALKQKLVAAYLVGFKVVKDSMKHLKPCDSSRATGCYVTWNTVSEAGLTSGSGPFFRGVCVNPLSWKQDSVYMDATYNIGALNKSFDGLPRMKPVQLARMVYYW